MTRKSILICTCFIVLLSFLSSNACAFKLAPEYVCEIQEEETPLNAEYFELLVLKEDLQKYNLFSEQCVHLDKYVFNHESEIAQYNKDGYVCYMLHCKNSVGVDLLKSAIDGVYWSSFGADQQTECTKEMQTLLNNLQSIRFAYVDSFGKVLLVTNAAQVISYNPLKERDTIRISGDKVNVVFSSGPPYWLIPFGALVYIGSIAFLIVWTKRKNKRQQ